MSSCQAEGHGQRYGYAYGAGGGLSTVSLDGRVGGRSLVMCAGCANAFMSGGKSCQCFNHGEWGGGHVLVANGMFGDPGWETCSMCVGCARTIATMNRQNGKPMATAYGYLSGEEQAQRAARAARGLQKSIHFLSKGSEYSVDCAKGETWGSLKTKVLNAASIPAAEHSQYKILSRKEGDVVMNVYVDTDDAHPVLKILDGLKTVKICVEIYTPPPEACCIIM